MIKELVPLRFVLILMIFFHHTKGFAAGGWAAVAYFFVLSGFCMMLGYQDKVMKHDFSYLSYLKRRFSKVYPLHWITLLVVLGIMFWNGETIGNAKTLLVNILLLQSWVPDMDVYFSYNAVSWYLSSGLLAIALFPMIVIFLERLSVSDRCIFGGLILMAYVAVAFQMPCTERHAMLYVHPVARLIDFIAGVYLAYGYTRIKNNKRLMTWVLQHGVLLDIGFVLSFVTIVVIAVCFNDSIRAIAGIFWLPVAISLLCLTLGEHTGTKLHQLLQTKTIGILTQCSFSMMMWHLIVIQQVSCTPPPCRGCSFAIKLFASYVIAQISYYLIEKKLYDTSISRL